jgi:hypothetical protein
MNDANADWKTGDDAYRGAHTMLKEDGLTANEIDWL